MRQKTALFEDIRENPGHVLRCIRICKRRLGEFVHKEKVDSMNHASTFILQVMLEGDPGV